MTNIKKFDLEERTAKFGEKIIEFAKRSLKKQNIGLVLAKQAVAR